MLTRSQRRAISRDDARANPVALRPRSHGYYASVVNALRPLPRRAPSRTSGQTRINAKRNERAVFWSELTEANA